MNTVVSKIAKVTIRALQKLIEEGLKWVFTLQTFSEKDIAYAMTLPTRLRQCYRPQSRATATGESR